VITRLHSPACTCPYRRFANALANANARLGVTVGRYPFDVELFHLLLHAGLSRRTYGPVRRRVPRRYSVPYGFSPLGTLPLASPPGGSIGTRLPTFRARAADQAHVAYMPDTAWPISGHPPDSSRANSKHPVLMSPLRNDTSPATPLPRGCAPSSWSPPDASRAPFPPRSPRRSSANAAGGGLKPPPAGRLRRANSFISRTASLPGASPTSMAPFRVRGAPGFAHHATVAAQPAWT
jgi:hypothetical protein